MDTQKYERVMQSIKWRKEYISETVSHAHSTGRISTAMIESICLQLRMTIEDIAVACVVANADELPELAHSLRRAYSPKRILKGLEGINPDCYPIPMVENLTASHGNFRATYPRPEGDWLTREEAVKEYGRLGNIVHRNLKAYEGDPVDYVEVYTRCAYLNDKISNLLSHHQITVLNENMMYRILMSGTGVDDNGVSFEGRIQVAEFTRIT